MKRIKISNVFKIPSFLLRRYLVLSIVFPLTVLPFTAQAYVEGELVPDGGIKQFYVNLGTNGIENVPGMTRTLNYDLHSNFSGAVYCTANMTGQTFYRAITSLTPSAGVNGYYQLNDFLDVKIEIWIEGLYKDYVTAPFSAVSNKQLDICEPPYTRTMIGTGSKGRVTMRVRKKMVNGVELHDQLLVRLFGRMGAQGAFGGVPMSEVFVQSAVLQVPDKCEVNAGQEIRVEFGAVDSASLDGKHYTQNIPLRVKCSGGSFDEGSLNISLRLAGDLAPFSDEMLKTSRDNLGILITHDGQPVIPGRDYPQRGFDNGGEWNLQATPQAKPGTDVAEGGFSASAILTSSFQ